MTITKMTSTLVTSGFRRSLWHLEVIMPACIPIVEVIRYAIQTHTTLYTWPISSTCIPPSYYLILSLVSPSIYIYVYKSSPFGPEGGFYVDLLRRRHRFTRNLFVLGGKGVCVSVNVIIIIIYVYITRLMHCILYTHTSKH